MKIKIGGVSLEEYNSVKHWDELGIVLKQTENFNLESYYDNFGFEDSIVGDMIVGAYKGTKLAIKAGTKTYGAISKGWSGVKTQWINNRPQMIKMIKDFGLNLQDMWAKYMQYDTKYVELGKEINQILKFTIPQMGDIPNINLFWHDFNANRLKDMLDTISSYKTFHDAIVNSNMFKGKYISGEEMLELVRGANTPEDVKALADRLSLYSSAIGELNDYGEAGFIKVLDNIFHWNLYGLLGQYNSKKDVNVPIAEIVKRSILGDQMNKSYKSGMKQDFVMDLASGGGSFLNVLASFLNNEVLTNALKKGGPSVRTETDKMIKYFDQIMKQADIVEKRQGAKEQEEEKRRAREEAEADRREKEREKNEEAANSGSGVQFPSFDNLGGGSNSNDSSNNADPNNLDALMEMYTQNQVLFFAKVGNAYGGIMRGILSASYEIIGEASNIVSIIQTSATKVK